MPPQQDKRVSGGFQFFALRIPTDLHEHLRERAYRERRSMTSIILEALKASRHDGLEQ